MKRYNIILGERKMRLRRYTRAFRLGSFAVLALASPVWAQDAAALRGELNDLRRPMRVQMAEMKALENCVRATAASPVESRASKASKAKVLVLRSHLNRMNKPDSFDS